MIDTSTTLSSEIIYCKCGCGSVLQPGRTWVKNHHGRDPENRRKISEANTGLLKHTDESKRKISEAHKNKIVSEETRNKISSSNLGRHLTTDQCIKISEANKGRPAWNKGISPTDETILKLKIARKLQIRPSCSEETKLKMSRSLKGRRVWNIGLPLSQETKDKISEKVIGRPSPHKGKKMTQEFCDKLSISLKGREPWNKGKTDCYTEDARQRMRESCIDRIKKMNNGEMIHANIGTLEKLCLDTLQSISNQNIQRQYRVIGYFLDGYIPELNIAIEFDEKSCHTAESSIKRDIIRQVNIEKQLNCIFFRIKENEWNLNKQQVIEKFQILMESITQHPIAVGE